MASSDSLFATGSVTSAAAGAAIATITAPAAGTYEVRVVFSYSGTAETTANNARVKKGATNLVTLFAPASGTSVNTTVLQVSMNGTDDLTVNAIALAVVGSIYNANIIATKL